MDYLLLGIITISIIVGILCFYKGFILRKKAPKENRWKIFLFLGSLFTFIIPGIIILIYYYYFARQWVTCYEVTIAGLASTSIAVRKELFNKFFKGNKISQRIYNKIYKGD